MRIGVHDKKKLKSKTKTPVLQSGDEEEVASTKPVGLDFSGNLIETIYSPHMKSVADNQAEKCAEELLSYEEAMAAWNASHEGEEETDTVNPDAPTEPKINSYLFGTAESREEMLAILSETSQVFTSAGKGAAAWKVHANAAKFERQLDEKYGVFRPFITEHPEIEIFIRGVQRKYSRGEYSPFREETPIDTKTSIIILFIMHRNGVKMENMVLAVLFLLVGLQPLALVALVILGRQQLNARKRKKIARWLADEVKTVKPYYADAKNDKEKHDILRKPVGTPISNEDFKTPEVEGEETYDTIIVGSGPDTMYTAALLARTGRTVAVLSPDLDASGCRSLAETNGLNEKNRKIYKDIPFDVNSTNVAHIGRQQRLLVPALCTESDAQGGIRFSRIGTEADGFTSDIVSIPGMGVDNRKDSHPFILRAGGVYNIAIDTATYLGDGWPDEEGVGNSTAAGYLASCAGVNASASDFYVSKLLPENMKGAKKNSAYQEASVRYASAFLDQMLPLNAHVRSLMAGLGMKGENLAPSKTSMAVHVTNACAQTSPEGFSYPIGGPRALCHAFASVIEQNGGKVFTSVKLKEFLFHETEEMKSKEEVKSTKADGADPSKPRCTGVKLADGRIISVGDDDDCSVISMLGFIETFIFYMPDEIRVKYGIPSGVPALSERRPLIHFLVGLDGTSEDLSITGADWYRLPNASLALDEMDPNTGAVKQGLIGAQVIDFNEEEEDETKLEEVEGEDTGAKRDKRSKAGVAPKKKTRRNKFEIGQSWIKISFPSAKDPSWESRHGSKSTCVITIEADDNYVQQFESAPQIFSNTKYGNDVHAHTTDKVTADLLATFPQLKDKIDFMSMIGPIRKGLSHTPLRYAVKGLKPVSPYPGLYMGGADLTVGDSFSAAMVGGWMAANAVLKYSFIDHLYLEKNITNDLKQFLASPRTNGEEDVAVPFAVKKSDELPQSAESSKEE